MSGPIKIPIHNRPKILLFGNGICRAMGKRACDRIIDEIRKKYNPSVDPSVLGNLPFTQQIVVASGDSVKESMKALAKEMTSDSLDVQEREFVKSILDIGADAVLTANYSYELEQAYIENFSSYQYRLHRNMTTDVSGTPEKTHHFQYTELSREGFPSPIWHIHGEAYLPSSIIIGHYYYGKQLRDIQQYVPTLIRRHKKAEKENTFMDMHSWIDYLLLGDVHVVGFSFDTAESDLWWLACCKKRHFPDSRIILHSPGKIDPASVLLMNSYGIIADVPMHFSGDYKSYYQDTAQRIKQWR